MKLVLDTNVLVAGLRSRTGASNPLLVAGFLGGFTTFSAFSLDALKLWEGGAAVQAALYIAASVILSLAAVALGAAIARSIPA